MNIKDFKIGDIITRNEPCIYSNNTIDGSYLGEKFELLAYSAESKMLKLKHLDGLFKGNDNIFSFGKEKWDEGWILYPKGF